MQELTRKSLNLAWKNYLSNDWLPANKAHKFPVDKFYVDLEWAKMVKEALKTVKKDLRNIYDVMTAAKAEGTNILVEGSIHCLKFIDPKRKRHALFFVHFPLDSFRSHWAQRKLPLLQFSAEYSDSYFSLLRETEILVT